MVSQRGRNLAICMAIFTFVVLWALALRFYVLFRLRKRGLRPDDFLILLSAAATFALEGTVFWAIHNGLGAPTASLPWSQVAIQIKLLISAACTWTIATCACKLAVSCIYLELVQCYTLFTWAVRVIMLYTVAYLAVFMTYFMTQCDPLSAAWDPVLSKTNCRPIVVQEIISVATNLVLDLLVVLAPLPVIWRLRIRATQKLAVTAMFGLGISVIAVMIWRLVTTTSPAADEDLVYDLYILALQCLLEIWLGILAANLPRLGPLFDLTSTSTLLKCVFCFRSDASSLKAPRETTSVHPSTPENHVTPACDNVQFLPTNSDAKILDGKIMKSEKFLWEVKDEGERSGGSTPEAHGDKIST